MGKATFSDPNFYLVSDSFQYTIRGEMQLEEEIDGKLLEAAVQTAFQRYPYFSVQLICEDNEYLLVPNDRPHNILHTNEQITIGSSDVNYHLFVISYYGKSVFFNVSHCITDGTGRAPLAKTILYYYLTAKYQIDLDTEGINLAGSELFPDETGLPLPEAEFLSAESTFYTPVFNAFRLSDHPSVSDQKRVEYRFSVKESELMAVCRSIGASPASIASAWLAEIAWEQNPDTDQNIIVDMCVNMRPGLNNQHSYMRLLSCIPMTYAPEQRSLDLAGLTKTTRSMIKSQSQPENIRYLYKQSYKVVNKILKMKSLSMKQKIMDACIRGPEGFLSSTFIESYVGRNNLGSLSPYIKAVFTTVDAIPTGGAMLEITSANDQLFFAFMQDFSSDVYLNALIRKIEQSGISVSRLGKGPVKAPRIQMPEALL